MSLVALQLLGDGSAVNVEANEVESVTALPAVVRPASVADACRVVAQGRPYWVRGSVAAVNATIAAGQTSGALATTTTDGLMSADEFDQTFKRTRMWRYVEDFENGITGSAWASNVSGASAIAGSGNTTHPGMVGYVDLQTGTTATGLAAVHLRATTFGVLLTLGAREVRWESLVRIEDLATVAEDYIAFLGLGERSTAEPTDGVYFLYNRALSPNWLACVAEDGAITRQDTGVAVAEDANVRHRFEVNAAGTSVAFYVNGALVHTETGPNIPITADTLGGVVTMLKSAGTTSRRLYCDIVSIEAEAARG